MSRPSSLPVWATNPGTTVTPSGGKQALGWEASERPPAEYSNHLHNLTYRWLQYFANGVFSPASMSGTVSVDASANTYTRTSGDWITDHFTVGQTVAMSGFTNGGNNGRKTITALTSTVMTVDDTGAVLVTESGNGNENATSIFEFDYDVDIDGSLDVDGGGNFESAVVCQSTVQATGLITATGGVTCGANTHVTLSGTGEVKHGDRTMTFQLGAAATIVSGTWTRTLTTGFDSTAAGQFFVALPLKQGDRAKSMTISRFGDGAADITKFSFHKQTSTAGVSEIGSTSETNPSAAWADLSLDFTDETLDAGEAVFVNVEVNATGLRFGTLRVVYDRP